VDDDSVRQYLRSAGAHPLLTAADEVELGKAIAAGRAAAAQLLGSDELDDVQRAQLLWLVDDGDVARERFIASNLRLVISIARRYRTGLPLADLIQEGNLGLMRAVEKFDHQRGFKFSTYATWWIRQAISRAIADKGRTIRVPAHVSDQLASVERAEAELTRRRGRTPSLADLAQATGISVERISEVRAAAREVVSLQSPVGDDGELADLLTDEEAVSPEDELTRHHEQRTLFAALERLTDRERRVLQLRFGLAGGDPRTLEDVGKEFAVTRERIRQIEAKALTKLRHPSTPAALRQLVAAG
jgi:RNA polymerase primary sigma factor